LITLLLQDTERVLVELLLAGYLADEYNATAYSVNVYVKPGPMSGRLSRLSKEQVEGQSNGRPTILVKLLDPGSKRSTKRKSKKASRDATVDSDSDEEEEKASRPLANKAASSSRPIKKKPAASPWTNKVDLDDEGFIVDDESPKDQDEDEDDEQSHWEADASSVSNKHNPIEIDSD
jgi:ATP-dependent DNA helicase Q1